MLLWLLYQSWLLGLANNALVLPGEISSNWSTPLHPWLTFTRICTCSNDINWDVTPSTTCTHSKVLHTIGHSYQSYWRVVYYPCVVCLLHLALVTSMWSTVELEAIPVQRNDERFAAWIDTGYFSTSHDMLITLAAIVILNPSNRPKPCSLLWWNSALFLTQWAPWASTFTAVYTIRCCMSLHVTHGL